MEVGKISGPPPRHARRSGEAGDQADATPMKAGGRAGGHRGATTSSILLPPSIMHIEHSVVIESPALPGWFLQCCDTREMKPASAQPFPEGAEVDFICPDPNALGNEVAAQSFLARHNARILRLAGGLPT